MLLDLWADSLGDPSPQPGEGSHLPAGFGDTFDAAWQRGELFSNSVSATNARNQAIAEFSQKVQAAGGDVASEYANRLAPGPDGGVIEPDGLDVANSALAAARTKSPAVNLQPMTSDDIDRRALEIQKGAVANYDEMQGREKTFGGKVGSVAGSALSGLNDPLNLPALAISPEAEGGYLSSALIWGGYGVGSQRVNEAINAQRRQQIDPTYSPGAEIAEAGIAGAGLGVTVRGLGDLWTRVATGAWPRSVRDAGNAVASEANVQASNILPGAEGEAAHRDALGRSLDQIINGDPVMAEIGPASRELMARLHAERPFAVPKVDGAELARISEEAGLRERQAALGDQLAGLPEGDRGAAETLARLDEIDRQRAAATTADERRALGERRDELLTDTTPEALRAAAAPLEQRRLATRELEEINGRLNEIAVQRAKLSPEEITEPLNLGQTSRVPPSLFDIHLGRVDNTAEMLRLAEMEPAEMGAAFRNGVEGNVRNLASLTGHDMPREDAAALTDRLLETQDDWERRAILNEIVARPRTIRETLPGAAEIAAARRGELPAEPPLSADAAAAADPAVLQDPGMAKALQADAERLLDARAAAGQDVRVPAGVDENGEPVYRSIADMIEDAKADERAAEQIEACVKPMSEQPEEA